MPPLYNVPQDDKEVVNVIDPTHPLFGQRFRLISVSRQPGRARLVTAVYGEDARLLLPLSVTDRADYQLRRF